MTWTASTHTDTGPRGLVCPACHRALERRQRDFGDGVLALFADPARPLRRYACTDPRCAWQGLLRGHLPRPPSYLPEQWL